MRLPTSAGSDDIGEKWSDSGYMLKAEPIGLVDLLGVMIKERIQRWLQCFWPKQVEG